MIKMCNLIFPIRSVWQFLVVLDGHFAQLHTLTFDLINDVIPTEINERNKVSSEREFD